MEKVKKPNLPLCLRDVFHHSQNTNEGFLDQIFSFYILRQKNFKPNMDIPPPKKKPPFNFLNENVDFINWVTNS